mgnify:CR=1 FL=1
MKVYKIEKKAINSNKYLKKVHFFIKKTIANKGFYCYDNYE